MPCQCPSRPLPPVCEACGQPDRDDAYLGHLRCGHVVCTRCHHDTCPLCLPPGDVLVLDLDPEVRAQEETRR